MNSLTLPEQLLLLAIDDQRGVINTSTMTTLLYGLAGAVLAELALRGKIGLEEKRLKPTDNLPTGDPNLDSVLSQIADEPKPRKLARWVMVFARKDTLRKTAQSLAEQRVISIENKRFLWVIPYESYPQVDAPAKYWIKQHLRAVVLAGETAEPGEVALLSLLKASRLLQLVFTRDERRYAGKHIDAIVTDEVYGAAVGELLAEIDTATITAIAAASS
jgi:hypothetical protein